eukprot:6421909-Amphidinium_carterae.1
MSRQSSKCLQAACGDACGSMAMTVTSAAPPLSPTKMTREGSPPKVPMFLYQGHATLHTQSNAVVLQISDVCAILWYKKKPIRVLVAASTLPSTALHDQC